MKAQIRRFCLVLCLLLPVMLLAACGGDDDAGGGASDAESSKTFEELVAQKPEASGPDGEKAVAEVKVTSDEADRLKQLDSEREYTFGYSVHDASLDYWKDVATAYEETINRYMPSAKVIITDAELKPAKQLNDLESMRAQGADIAVVATVDETAATPGLEEWNKDGIPLVSYNTVGDSVETDGLCGSDNYGGGWLTGAFLADYLGGEGKVASIEFAYRQWYADQRNQGFVDAAEAGGLDVAAKGQALDQAEGESVFENMLTANPDLDGAFAMWDGPGLGMAQAVTNLGLEDQVAVVTHDLTTGSAVPIRDGGVLKAAAVHFPKRIGENCANIALKRIAGTDTSDIVALTAEELATPEDVDEYHQEVYGVSIDEAL